MRILARASVLSLLLVAGSAYGLKIQNDYDLGTDFLNFTTFAWKDGVHSVESSVHDQIVTLVEAALSKGYLRPIQSNPDLFVTYHATTTEELRIDTSQWGYSFGPRWQWGGGMGESTTTVQVYPAGTLVVDLWEKKTQRLVWRGAASDTIAPDPTQSVQKIRKALQDMFLNFPPQTQPSS